MVQEFIYNFGEALDIGEQFKVFLPSPLRALLSIADGHVEQKDG